MIKFKNNLGPQEKEINLFLEKMEKIDIGTMIRINAYESRNRSAGIRNQIEANFNTEDLDAIHDRVHAYSTLNPVIATSLFEKYDEIWEETFDALDEIAPFEDFEVLRTIQVDSIADVVNAACDTFLGLLMRDFFYDDDYYTLTKTWRTIVGPIHPDDPDLHPPKENEKRWSISFYQSETQPPTVGVTTVKTYPRESE